MKKLFLVILLISISGYGQEEIDTVISKKVSSSWYVRTIPIALLSTNQQGETLKERIGQNIEIGKSFGMIDIGIGFGKANTISTDSTSFKTQFIETKLTMDACQYGIFSNEITIGAGYMFNKTTPVILEISSTIFAQVGENWGLGVVYGNYNFTGDTNDINKTFTGLFLRYGLIRDDGGILLSRTRVARGKRPNRSRTHHNNN